MNDQERVKEFIVKSTGKTIGRSSKMELSMLFANTYSEYVKTVNQINQGYIIYKELEGKIDKISDAIKNMETVPTNVITKIIEEKPKEITNE
jgi:uncharacterized UPF0160 family protein|tara:strand:- start:464 stop:739 length:276 start_codon:yes stop_codon:yes gene_type:complete